MCNLFSHTRNVEAMRKLFAKFDVAAQVVPQPGIFPDYAAPIARNPIGGGSPELAMARWGKAMEHRRLEELTSLEWLKRRA
jgi:putative SOS response-associated peptidase YedK